MIADDREVVHHAGLVEALRQSVGDLTVQRLEFGDYSWTGKLPTEPTKQVSVGLEYCTVSDFAKKITNGQLAYQLLGMVSTYDVRILLIEGIIRPTAEGRLHLYGATVSPAFHVVRELLFSAACHGVIVQYSVNPQDTLQAIVAMHKYWQKDKHTFFRPSYVHQVTTLSPGDPIQPAVQYLMGLPPILKVGEERAKAALAVAGSLERIHTMSEHELRKIPGWGPVLARRFRQFVTKEEV